MERLFADTSRRAEDERRAEGAKRFADLRASLSRLVRDEDFRSLYLYLAYEFCSADFGTRSLPPETQGVRMAMAKINETLSVAVGGPELISLAALNHFKAVGESIARERTRTDRKEAR